jgi:hypothetical protein
MAWPESLTADQQRAVTDFTLNLRSFASLLAQAVLLGQQINVAYGGGIGTYVNSLQATDVIPNTSGLAGSQDLVQADVGNLAGWAALISNPATAPAAGSYAGALAMGTMVKAAGINATL